MTLENSEEITLEMNGKDLSKTANDDPNSFGFDFKVSVKSEWTRNRRATGMKKYTDTKISKSWTSGVMIARS